MPLNQAADAVLLWLARNAQAPFSQSRRTERCRKVFDRRREGFAAAIDALVACGLDLNTRRQWHHGLDARCGRRCSRMVSILAPRVNTAVVNALLGWDAFAQGQVNCLRISSFFRRQCSGRRQLHAVDAGDLQWSEESVRFLLPLSDALMKSTHGYDAFDNAVSAET